LVLLWLNRLMRLVLCAGFDPLRDPGSAYPIRPVT